jgi:hypothetical protein
MFWDILIAAGVSVTQLAITAYGVIVSVQEKRLKIAAVIGIVGGIGIGLTIWGAIRSGTTQQKLEADIVELKTGQQTANAGIKHIEQTPPAAPVINVNTPNPPPPPSLSYLRRDSVLSQVNGIVAHPLTPDFARFTNTAGNHENDFYFVNPGPGPAKDVLYGASAFLIPGGNTKATEELGFAKFKNWWLDHQKVKHPEFWSLGDNAASPAKITLSAILRVCCNPMDG